MQKADFFGHRPDLLGAASIHSLARHSWEMQTDFLQCLLTQNRIKKANTLLSKDRETRAMSQRQTEIEFAPCLGYFGGSCGEICWPGASCPSWSILALGSLREVRIWLIVSYPEVEGISGRPEVGTSSDALTKRPIGSLPHAHLSDHFGQSKKKNISTAVFDSEPFCCQWSG